MTSTETHLRTLAAAAGFRSLRALWLAAGIDPESGYRVASGQSCPRPATLQKLAVSLQVPVHVVVTVLTGGDPR